jgi:hypothetical protein
MQAWIRRARPTLLLLQNDDHGAYMYTYVRTRRASYVYRGTAAVGPPSPLWPFHQRFGND